MSYGLNRVQGDIERERDAQDAKWGEQNHPDGTGSIHMKGMRDVMIHRCETAFAKGFGTWEHILTEEVCEAFGESNVEKLRMELVQVAAVCVAWIEAIDRRSHD